MLKIAKVLSIMPMLLFGLSGIMLVRTGYYTATRNQFAMVEFGIFLEVAGAFIFTYWLWTVANSLAKI